MVQAHSFFIKQDATSGQGSSATVDGEKVARRPLSTGVLFSSSFLDISCGAEAGCWAGFSLWSHLSASVYDLEVSHLISSQNCLVYVGASLFLTDVSSCHAEILPPALPCLHRTFRRRSGTSSLQKVLSFPADHSKGAIWLGIRASIFVSIFFFFFVRNIIFADNLSDRSQCNSPQADWWFPGAGVARLAAEHSFLQRLRWSTLGLWMDCICRQLRSCSMLTFYGVFFLLIMSNTSHPGAVGFPSPSHLGHMNLPGTLYLTFILPE